MIDILSKRYLVNRNRIRAIVLFCLMTSCANRDKNTVPVVPASDSISVDGSQSPASTDTLVIDKRAAVFYGPDSLRMEKRMKEVGEENFRVGADDYLFYMHLSYDFLDSLKLPVLETKEKKLLKFMTNDGKLHLIKLDTLPELWGIYFFDPAKQPKTVDMTNIEDEYQRYFK